jgi:hypothetical protein
MKMLSGINQTRSLSPPPSPSPGGFRDCAEQSRAELLLGERKVEEILEGKIWW